MNWVGVNGKRDNIVYILSLSLYLTENIVRPLAAAFLLTFSNL
jgi:hypothetical protein